MVVNQKLMYHVINLRNKITQAISNHNYTSAKALTHKLVTYCKKNKIKI